MKDFVIWMTYWTIIYAVASYIDIRRKNKKLLRENRRLKEALR